MKVHPILEEKLRMFLNECKKQGIEVKITSTYRSLKEQEALYLQGRASLEEVNRARSLVGLRPITQVENRIVTYLRESPHNYGLAFDFVPLRNGKPVWNDNALWERCGKMIRKLNLEWGGDWKDFQDKPHVQVKNWQSYKTGAKIYFEEMEKSQKF